MRDLKDRVKDYWTGRVRDFAAVRKNELADDISGRWIAEMETYLPRGRSLDILDAGTGTGYFAILLSKRGHRLTGIDLTPAMIEEAGKMAADSGVSPRFLTADAQGTEFADSSFDAVVTRNLTWTLPDPPKACREWFRLLRPGGVLLNFDADYARNVRNHNQKESYIQSKDVYGHADITPEQSRENAEITLAAPAGSALRPEWDMELLHAAGFSSFGADLTAGKRILREKDLSDAPLFLVWAEKR